ncbi:MAG: HRDC domain-containing protein [Thermodesulfobacteriota bacterium]
MFKIITIPFDRNNGGFDEDLLNRAVLNKHVKSYQAKFFQDGESSYWTVLLFYDPVIEPSTGKSTEDLDDTQRLLLDRLKAWRKERAEKDGVPVFLIGANGELIGVVKNKPFTLEALKSIRGFGKSKVSRYGQEIIEIVQAFYT